MNWILPKMAWRNIWRNRRRSFITVGMMALAVFLSICMRSMQEGTYNQMIDGLVKYDAGYLSISHKDFGKEKDINQALPIPNDTLIKWEETTPAIFIAPRIESVVYATHGNKAQPARVIALDFAKEKENLELDDKLEKGNLPGPNEAAVVIGKGLAKKLALQIGDSIVVQGQGYHGLFAAGKYPLAGILDIANPVVNNQMVYIPLAIGRELFGMPAPLATSYNVQPKAFTPVEEVQAQLRPKLDTTTAKIETWKELNPELYQGIQGDAVGGQVMIFILYMVISFGIFGTILMMTAERQYEFGVMVSIGMKRMKLGWMLLIETLLMGFLGMVSGSLLAFPLVYYVYKNPIQFSGITADSMEDMGFEPAMFTTIDYHIPIEQAIVVFSIIAVLSIYPLMKVFKLKPVEAMRN